MKLALIDDEGQVHVVCPDIEEYDLDKRVANSQIGHDIRRGINRISTQEDEDE